MTSLAARKAKYSGQSIGISQLPLLMYNIIICGGSADRNTRRRWADNLGQEVDLISILDVITEPFHA